MKNIANIKKLEFKNLKFHIIIFIPFIALIYSMIMSLNANSFNLVYLLFNPGYKALLMISFIAIGIKIGHNKFEVMDSYNIKPYEIVLGKILLILEFTLIVSIIEFVFMIGLSIYTGVSAEYMLNASIGNIILIFVECIFAGTLGVVLGLFLKKIISYLISALVLLAVLSPSFNIETIQRKASLTGIDKAFDTSSKLIRSFAIDYFTGKNINIATLFNFDSVFFSHQLIFVLISVIVILTSVVIINMKNKYPYKKFLFSVILLSITFLALINYQITNMPLPFSYNTFENDLIENNNYAISSYNMNINLNRTLENTCTINIVNNNTGTISLKFNDTAAIHELKVNDILANYKLDNNILTISLPESNENLKIDLTYDLDVNYIDKFLRENYYVKQNGAMLTNNIYWYPTNSNMDEKKFDISVTTKNMLVSNLENYKIDSNLYSFKGKSKDFFLMSGYIKEFEINDSRVIAYEGTNYEILRTESKYNEGLLNINILKNEISIEEKNINNMKNKNGKISTDPLTQMNFKIDTISLNTYKNRLSLIENNEIENPIYIYSQNSTFSAPYNNPNEIAIYDNYIFTESSRLISF